MGLLSKLKAAKNFVTGGGAEIRVRPTGDPCRGSALELQVGAKIKEGEMAVSRVYVKIRAVERIEFVDRSHGEKETERKNTNTYEAEFDIADGATLVAGEDYSWNGSIQIPADTSATYLGRYCKHEWEVCAFLDKKGNDPDSGWKTILMA